MDNLDDVITIAFEERYSPPPGLAHDKLEAAINAKTIRSIRLLSLSAVFLTVMITLGVLAIAGVAVLFYISIVSLAFVALGGIAIAVLCPQLVNEQARRCT